MRFPLIFLALIPVFAFCDNNPICVTRTLQFCQVLFNQKLNVTSSSADWTNPGTLSFILQSYYLKGFDGLLSVCHARQQFAQCLDNQYDACLSDLHFISSGQTPENARDYVQIFKTLEFDCNGGFIQSSRHWPCISYILQANSSTLTNCKQNYLQGLAQNPSNICSLASTFETCNRAPFADFCGIETSWWECERTRRGYSIDQLCPKNTCNFESATLKSRKNGDQNILDFFNNQSAHGRVLKHLADKQKQI